MSESLPDQGGRALVEAIENATRGRSAIDTLEAIVSAFCTAIGEPIPQDAIRVAGRLRVENERLRDIGGRAVDALRYEANPVCDEWDALSVETDEQEAPS